MFYLAGIIITLFLAFILLSKKGKTTADHVLVAWLCVIGFHLFLYYIQITGVIYDHTYLLGLQVPMPLLHGPFLYIYTLTLARDQGFSKRYWLHFIPAAVTYPVLTKFFILSPAEKIIVYKNHGAGFEVHSAAILLASLMSGFVYVLLSVIELRKYKKRIAEEFSNTERINLNWLRYLIYGILSIWLVILFSGNDPTIFAVVVVFVLFLGYFGIKHMGIFTYRQVIVKEIPAALVKEIRVEPIAADLQPDIKQFSGLAESGDRSASEASPVGVMQVLKAQPPAGPKYEKTALQKEVADKIHQELQELMQRQKIFKKEELSLAQLARELGVHPNNLSQVINTCENKSFYDYINTLRIEEFKSLAARPENSRYTLLSLAFECGFNSKTSFNRNFKKITGLSPSAWLKEMDVQLVA